MGGRCLRRRRRRGMALLVLVVALEHPMVMDTRIDGAIEDQIGLELVLSRPRGGAAFDRCALLSIWKAEGPRRAEVHVHV